MLRVSYPRVGMMPELATVNELFQRRLPPLRTIHKARDRRSSLSWRNMSVD